MQFSKEEILHSFQLFFPFFQEGCPTNKVTLTQDKKTNTRKERRKKLRCVYDNNDLKESEYSVSHEARRRDLFKMWNYFAR